MYGKWPPIKINTEASTITLGSHYQFRGPTGARDQS